MFTSKLPFIRSTSSKLINNNTSKLFYSKYYGTSVAFQYTKHGQPDQVLKKTNLSFDDKIGGNNVQLKMLFAPINPADLNQIQGTYGKLAELPAVGGNEGVGVVERTGDSVKNVKKGDTVIFNGSGQGTWRTSGVFDAKNLVKVPKDIKPEYASVTAVGVCTAYRLLEDFVKLEKGDVVLANGGSSSVTSALAAIAKERGLKLVVAMRDCPDWEMLVDRLKAQGAEAVIPDGTMASPETKKIIADIGQPRLALNSVGGVSATDLARNLAEGGTLVTYGGMARQPVTLATSSLIFRDVNVRGFWMTRWQQNASDAERQSMLDYVFDLMRNDKLKVFVERHELSKFDGALKRAQESFKTHKVILNLSEK